MKTLELFCGTKSFSKVADKRGAETFTVDIEGRFRPTMSIDILELDPTLLAHDFDIIWASPPCTAFSVAAIGKNWSRNSDGTLEPKSDNALLGVKLLQKTIEIIKELGPKYWFIENPRGAMRKMPEVQEFHRKTVTYCQYGDSRMKPTDIWTNLTEWSPKCCKNGASCHVSAPRGSRTGTQGLKDAEARGVIPPLLFEEIFDAISKLEQQSK